MNTHCTIHKRNSRKRGKVVKARVSHRSPMTKQSKRRTTQRCERVGVRSRSIVLKYSKDVQKRKTTDVRKRLKRYNVIDKRRTRNYGGGIWPELIARIDEMGSLKVFEFEHYKYEKKNIRGTPVLGGQYLLIGKRNIVRVTGLLNARDLNGLTGYTIGDPQDEYGNNPRQHVVLTSEKKEDRKSLKPTNLEIIDEENIFIYVSIPSQLCYVSWLIKDRQLKLVDEADFDKFSFWVNEQTYEQITPPKDSSLLIEKFIYLATWAAKVAGAALRKREDVAADADILKQLEQDIESACSTLSPTDWDNIFEKYMDFLQKDYYVFRTLSLKAVNNYYILKKLWENLNSPNRENLTVTLQARNTHLSLSNKNTEIERLQSEIERLQNQIESLPREIDKRRIDITKLQNSHEEDIYPFRNFEGKSLDW